MIINIFNVQLLTGPIKGIARKKTKLVLLFLIKQVEFNLPISIHCVSIWEKIVDLTNEKKMDN